MTDRLAEIKARLEKANPKAWRYDTLRVNRTSWPDDQTFIVNAAEDVRWLIAALEAERGAMKTYAEVWPLAADETGLYLLTPDGPLPSLQVDDTEEPLDYARMVLMQRGLWYLVNEPKGLLHATSWRIEHDRETGANFQVDSFMAGVRPEGMVLDAWPEALPVTTLFAEEVGPAPTHGATEAPTVPWSHVLLHGLRHYKYQLNPKEGDATIAARLVELGWPVHLAPFKAVMAAMYRRLHNAA
jgi:hypothetical protein